MFWEEQTTLAMAVVEGGVGMLMPAKRGRHILPRHISEHADRCRDDVDGGMLVLFCVGRQVSLAITTCL